MRADWNVPGAPQLALLARRTGWLIFADDRWAIFLTNVASVAHGEIGPTRRHLYDILSR